MRDYISNENRLHVGRIAPRGKINRIMKNILTIKTAVGIFALALTALPVSAQDILENYNRVYRSWKDFGAGNVYYSTVDAVWLSGKPAFWYVRETPEGRQYVMVNALSHKRTPLFDHKQLAKEIARETGTPIRPGELHLRHLRLSGNGDTLRFNTAGRVWEYVSRKNLLTDKGAIPNPPSRPHWATENAEKGGGPVVSPDGSREAYIKNSNVYVRDLKSKAEKQLSIDGTDGNYYSSWIQWSPDGSKVAVCKIRPAQKRYIYHVESSPADQRQPKLHKLEYAKPGDELRFKVPCIFDTETGQAIIPSTELFSEQYDLTYPEWNADSKGIVFDYNQRGHKIYRVLELSAETGTVRPLVEETSDKYINYTRYFRHKLSDGRRMIWMSERDNWNHLYMYDRTQGKPSHQITRGEWYVREVLKVDENDGKIYFSANGVNPGEDPYNIRYYSIRFDGSEMTDLTPSPGNHKATFSPDMKYLVDVVSTPAEAPVATLRDGTTGEALMPLEQADITRLRANGWRAPEVFAAPGRDGKTLMWGIIQRPSHFDPSKKYPVIEYIYQGPGDQHVPKSFIPYNHWLTPMAELGFIVVMVDGMSTSFRSREFENVCYKNLKDAGLPDHMAWIKAAAAVYPEMDLERLGIYGCSAGGQESLNALLLYPDFYKAGYSACGCHDNRMDKIWWNELWMGYPVDDSYEACSNVANAHLLKRPLMLVVGELDDNVDPASTMQVANALIKANKPFELVVIPGARHTMGEAYGDHKRYDFFVRHLMGIDPPGWEDIQY